MGFPFSEFSNGTGFGLYAHLAEATYLVGHRGQSLFHIATFLPIAINAFDGNRRVVLVVLELIVIDNANPAFTGDSKYDAANREFLPRVCALSIAAGIVKSRGCMY